MTDTGTKPMKAVGVYARVSKVAKRQSNGRIIEAESHETQIAGIRRYCEARDWLIAGEPYVDLDQSGRKASRPALDRLMEDARRGRIDCICVTEISRFGRSVRNLVELLGKLESYGVRFIGIRQGLDTEKSNAVARFSLTILAAAAELESELTSERISAGVQRRKEKGLPVGRQPRVFNRERAREMVAKGMSLRDVGSELGVSRMTVKRAMEAAA